MGACCGGEKEGLLIQRKRPGPVIQMETPSANFEPYILARYSMTDDKEGNRNENVTDIGYGKDVFTGHEIEGHDSHCNHARLTNPGSSKLKVNFKVPVGHIAEVPPDAKFMLKVSYFAPW